MISCDRTFNKKICTLQYDIPQIDDCDDSPSLAAEACLACSHPPTSHVLSPENESDELSRECQNTARVPTLLRTSPTAVFQFTNTHHSTHICECIHIRAHTHAFTHPGVLPAGRRVRAALCRAIPCRADTYTRAPRIHRCTAHAPGGQCGGGPAGGA